MKNTIRVERARKEINQEQLADGVGVSRQTIHSIETEKSEPKVGVAIKIARFFGLRVLDVFEEDRG